MMSRQPHQSVDQLQAHVADLEQTLAETNRQSQRLAKHLETSAQISKAIASTLDIEILNRQIVDIIKEDFGFYQVAIYLIDNSAQWAVLQAAAGKRARAMQREGYRLPVDDQSIVGWISKTRQSCFYYFHTQKSGNGQDSSYHHTPPPPLAGRHLEMALPLIAKDRLVGTLHVQSTKGATFAPDDVTGLQNLADQIASAIDKGQLYAETVTERDKNSLLYEISNALSKAIDFDAITTTAVSFADRLGATSGEIHLLADTGEVYFKSTYPERNDLSDPERQTVVREILAQGLEAWVLKNDKSALISDTHTDDRWLQIEYPDQIVSVRSIICSPIRVGRDQLRGAISFVHPEPNHFNEQDLTRLGTLASQIAVALENAMLVNDIQHSLQETHLMLDISRQLAAAMNINDVYAALVKSIMAAGVERCALYMCDELDTNATKPTEIVFVNDTDTANGDESIGRRFSLSDYPTLEEITKTQETLVIDNVATDKRLKKKEREFLSEFGAQSMAINPLVARGRVIGFISIEHRTPYNFNERELAMYRTLCNQTTIAIENARQIQRSETALAETQLLYRAGRVLAGATNIQEVLEESLVEFLYSLGLDQGGITLLTPDKKFGQLMVYVQNSQVQDIEGLRFPIAEGVVYQELLLSGQPFTSYDVANDPRMRDFRSFNPATKPKSLLEAPLIIQGETVGWIGADSVKELREFSQREIDLARAMADQIAITIQNRRLLQETERRAEQLKAVAEVGESVSGMIDLNEILKGTVDLIRDRFGFYHVSIFLLNEAGDWAVVRASTGEVGKIMVERPHQLQVGGKSIVGYVTGRAKPRIALDVGEDAVHFNNPLLPNTRSEMALPLISRGTVMGALDVQSEAANAFTNEDIEILQIMADQVTAAIQNAQLFEQTQRRLLEQATLYGIGTKLGATLDLQEATDNLVEETATALLVAECALTLIEENSLHIISDFVKKNATPSIKQHRSEHIGFADSAFLNRVMTTKQELMWYADSNAPDTNSPEYNYLIENNLTALIIVPVLLRNEVIAFLEIYDNKPTRRFKEENISLLDSIALQAANTIENIRLYQAAEYRSTLLKTAADVSRAATSILDVDDLIKASVNLIRDSFSFYYVGLFLLDEAGEYAVLQAGTGEAGRLQVEAGHKLKIGGGSMIGWSVKNRQARIALDVGADAVHFQNPYLPDTHSEMALPLISREEVIGALTVQSVERGAFSDEDIILLQTMADQVANAIQNARFFTQTQAALAETETLYQISQELLSARDEESVYRVAMEAISRSGIDSSAIYMYIEDPNNPDAESAIEQKGIWTITGNPIFPNGTRFKASDLVMEQLVPLHEALLIEDIDTDPRLTERVRQSLKLIRIRCVLVLPLSTYQSRLGFLLVAYKNRNRTFSRQQIRFYNTVVQQMVVALENLRLLEASQRRARREEIIREISSKIRSTTNVDDILKTTIMELGKVLGASRGGVVLGVSPPSSETQVDPSPDQTRKPEKIQH
ncbi:MAG: GAF domain-containing protein [Anaerolineae bacterium]|nr:GAF domain-containing protein [Anaerolineae bacterium]